ncbi:MAG: signal peptidase I [Solimonas sp.]
MQGIHWDFAVILTALTLITGFVWLLDKLWLGPKRRAGLAIDAVDKPSSFVDFCRSFFPVIFVVLILRSFVAEPFRIPSGSMIPTLFVGDFILVNKFTYGFRDPVFHRKLIQMSEPQRGDIVVFRWPVDPSKDFIKRIIGLPGDHIVYRNKQLFVNGEAAPVDADGVFPVAGFSSVMYRMDEHLGDVEHKILVNPDRPADDFEFIVPPGEYFAMGDNRDNSEDSRRWGTLPERNLVGKAFFIWMSWDAENTRVNFSRIGKGVH